MELYENGGYSSRGGWNEECKMLEQELIKSFNNRSLEKGQRNRADYKKLVEQYAQVIAHGEHPRSVKIDSSPTHVVDKLLSYFSSLDLNKICQKIRQGLSKEKLLLDTAALLNNVFPVDREIAPRNHDNHITEISGSRKCRRRGFYMINYLKRSPYQGL